MTTWKEWSAWWRGIFHFHMQLSRFMPLEDAMRKISPSIWREILRRIFFFHRRPIERIGQLWIWFHISIRTFPKFPICSGKDFMQFVCLQVCGCLGQRGRERERVDPRRKLLIALVVLNCLQPLPKLSGEINIEKHYKIIFKKIQQHLRSADDRSWKDGIHGSDCSLKMSLYST